MEKPPVTRKDIGQSIRDANKELQECFNEIVETLEKYTSRSTLNRDVFHGEIFVMFWAHKFILWDEDLIKQAMGGVTAHVLDCRRELLKTYDMEKVKKIAEQNALMNKTDKGTIN